MIHAQIDEIIEDRVEWLLNAIALVTQNRMFLRDDPEEDKVATAAIYDNGKIAMRSLINQVSGLL